MLVNHQERRHSPAGRDVSVSFQSMKHEWGRELSPLNRTMRLPSTHSSKQMLHGNIKPLMVSSALPQEGVGTPGSALPLPNHPSHEPLPNKSHHDAKQRRRASAGREIPCMRPGEAGTASPPHPPLPSRSGCRHSPPLASPAKHTWMFFAGT